VVLILLTGTEKKKNLGTSYRIGLKIGFFPEIFILKVVIGFKN
jgi:hypothetical protein